MPSGEIHSAARAVQRAAVLALTTTVCYDVVVTLDNGHLGTWWAHSGLGSALRLTAFALTAVVPLLAIRLLAHLGRAPLPANTARAALATSAALAAGAGAGAGALGLALLLRWTVTGFPVPTAAAIAPAILSASTLALAAATGQALRSAQHIWDRPLTHLARTAVPARPDLADDLSILLARAVPGSALARLAARMTGGLDTWAWSPRRRSAAVSSASRATSTGAARPAAGFADAGAESAVNAEARGQLALSRG